MRSLSCGVHAFISPDLDGRKSDWQSGHRDWEQHTTVIGIVANIHESSIETAPNPEVYVPVTQNGDISGSELVMCSGLPIESLGPSVMRTLRSINPSQPATNFVPIQSIVAAPSRRVGSLRCW